MSETMNILVCPLVSDMVAPVPDARRHSCEDCSVAFSSSETIPEGMQLRRVCAACAARLAQESDSIEFGDPNDITTGLQGKPVATIRRVPPLYALIALDTRTHKAVIAGVGGDREEVLGKRDRVPEYEFVEVFSVTDPMRMYEWLGECGLVATEAKSVMLQLRKAFLELLDSTKRGSDEHPHDH